MNNEDHAEISELRRSRKQNRARKLASVVTAVAAGGAALLLVVVVMLFVRWSGIVDGRDPILGGPADHAELAEDLRNKGLEIEVLAAGPDLETPNRTEAGFIVGRGMGRGVVLVYLCQAPDHAQETAASFGAGSYYYGRFAFRPGTFNSNDVAASRALKRALDR